MTTSARPSPRGLPGDLSRALNAGPLVHVVVGSSLHGFAHAGSDHDAWIIVPEPRDHNPSRAARKSFQVVEVVDGRTYDTTVVGVSTWLVFASHGTPQALDVMFATGNCVEVDHFAALRRAFRACPTAAARSFRRHLGRIVDERSEDPKQRRHAFRMALNLHEIYATGRYNPTLTEAQKTLVLGLAAERDGFEERLSKFSRLDFVNR